MSTGKAQEYSDHCQQAEAGKPFRNVLSPVFYRIVPSSGTVRPGEIPLEVTGGGCGGTTDSGDETLS